jgi:uncharacterized protein (TIGR02444 family)
MFEMSEQLWTFALSFYRKAGVKEALLCLQNEGGVDVPILLCSIFMTVVHRTQLGRNEIDEMDSLSDCLRSAVIQPLRAMRTQLKKYESRFLGINATRLRSSILRTELGAEREQLLVLARYLSPKTQAADASNVTAAIQTVCRFYFDKGQLSQFARDRLNHHITTLDKAASSS